MVLPFKCPMSVKKKNASVYWLTNASHFVLSHKALIPIKSNLTEHVTIQVSAGLALSFLLERNSGEGRGASRRKVVVPSGTWNKNQGNEGTP